MYICHKLNLSLHGQDQMSVSMKSGLVLHRCPAFWDCMSTLQMLAYSLGCLGGLPGWKAGLL